jgi:hypothetical protein
MTCERRILAVNLTGEPQVAQMAEQPASTCRVTARLLNRGVMSFLSAVRGQNVSICMENQPPLNWREAT